MIGLGLALAQPERRILVVTGDGEMLMGLGALATIGVQRPPNLAIAVFDNGRYGETGMQAEPHRSGGRADRASRAPAASRKSSTSATSWGCAISPAASTRRRRPCSPGSRSAPTSRRGSCRRATASTSKPVPPRDRRRTLTLTSPFSRHARRMPGQERNFARTAGEFVIVGRLLPDCQGKP